MDEQAAAYLKAVISKGPLLPDLTPPSLACALRKFDVLRQSPSGTED